MAKKKKNRTREHRKLRFPDGSFSPEDLLNFVQWDSFVQDWKRLGFDDDDLRVLETMIMVGPKRQPVVGGTGAVRKIRMAKNNTESGKSSGVRVCYVYFEDFSVVLLLVAYGKDEQDNISAAGKRAMKSLTQDIENYFRNR